MSSDPPESRRSARGRHGRAGARRPSTRRWSRRWLWRWGRRLLSALLLAFALGCFSLWGLLSYYERDLPSIAELKSYRPPQVTRVLARDGTVMAELFIERRTVVSIDQIPKVMKLSVLAAEDADFYEHEGLDYLGMLRALIVNVRTGRARQGGSTITQQVVKNVLLGPERTFARKAREALLARRIEQALSKDEILELYLNHIYFGHGRYGIEEASRYYFGKGVGEVSLAEAALLAGLPKGPSVYSPRVNFDKARRRRNQVLEQLADKGFAPRERVAEAVEAPIALAPATDAMAELAPEVVEEVRRALRDLVGPAAARGGYTVTTSIDPGLQAAARAAVRRNLDEYAKRHGLLGPLEKPKPRKKGRRRGRRPQPFEGVPKAVGHHVYWAVVLGADDGQGLLKVRVGSVQGTVRLTRARRYNPKALPPSRFAEPGTLLRVSPVVERGVDADGRPRIFRLELGPQGALVALDVTTRQVLALVGSYEAVRGGLDRASFARRQPGSTFKPVVYSYGIHTRRLTAATAVEPESDELDPADGQPPATGGPDAGAGAPAGPPPLRVRQALAKSVNSAAQWALGEVGAEGVVTWANALGITSKLGATESLALGAYEVTPRELATAYATLAAGGVYRPAVLVTRVVGPDGKEVQLPRPPSERRVMEPAEAYVMTSLLTSVVQEGTGYRARALKRSIAGKTGTSNDAKDAWFAGYSPDVVCVVWTGYDDAVPLGSGEAGAKTALPAFVDFMQAAHRGQEPKRFSMPEGVVRVAIDPVTGLLAYEDQPDAFDEVFLVGTEPTEQAEVPDAGADAAVDAGVSGEPAAVPPSGRGGPGPMTPGPSSPVDGPSRPAPSGSASAGAPSVPPPAAPTPVDPPPF